MMTLEEAVRIIDGASEKDRNKAVNDFYNHDGDLFCIKNSISSYYEVIERNDTNGEGFVMYTLAEHDIASLLKNDLSVLDLENLHFLSHTRCLLLRRTDLSDDVRLWLLLQ